MVWFSACCYGNVILRMGIVVVVVVVLTPKSLSVLYPVPLDSVSMQPVRDDLLPWAEATNYSKGIQRGANTKSKQDKRKIPPKRSNTKTPQIGCGRGQALLLCPVHVNRNKASQKSLDRQNVTTPRPHKLDAEGVKHSSSRCTLLVKPTRACGHHESDSGHWFCYSCSFLHS